MFGGGGLRIGIDRTPEQVVGEEPVPAVRILHRVDDHQRLAQRQIDIGALTSGEQMVGLLECGLPRRNLVAVNAMDEPDDHRQFGNEPIGVSRSGAEHLHPPPDVVQPGDALARSHNEVMKRPALPTRRVVHQASAIRRSFRQRFEVTAYLVRCGDLLPGIVPDDRFQRGDRRIVLRAR